MITFNRTSVHSIAMQLSSLQLFCCSFKHLRWCSLSIDAPLKLRDARRQCIYTYNVFQFMSLKMDNVLYFFLTSKVRKILDFCEIPHVKEPSTLLRSFKFLIWVVSRGIVKTATRFPLYVAVKIITDKSQQPTNVLVEVLRGSNFISKRMEMKYVNTMAYFERCQEGGGFKIWYIIHIISRKNISFILK